MRRRQHHHTSRTSSMNFHLYPVPLSILTCRVHPIDTPPQASMRASPTRTRPSTAGRTTSTTTSASSPRVRTSSLAVRYNCLPIHRQPSSNTCLMHTQFFLAYRSLCPSSWATRWDDQRGESPIAPQHAYSKSMSLIIHCRERHLPRQTGRVNARSCVTNQFSFGILGSKTSPLLSIASIIEEIISLLRFFTDPRAISSLVCSDVASSKLYP